MAPVLRAVGGRDGWGHGLSHPPPRARPAVLLPSRLHLRLMLPGRAGDGASPLPLSLRVSEGEVPTSRSLTPAPSPPPPSPPRRQPSPPRRRLPGEGGRWKKRAATPKDVSLREVLSNLAGCHCVTISVH